MKREQGKKASQTPAKKKKKDMTPSAEPAKAEVKPVDAQPVDAQPVDAQPVDAQPVDAQPVDAQPVDAQPVEVKQPTSDPSSSPSITLTSGNNMEKSISIGVGSQSPQKSGRPPIPPTIGPDPHNAMASLHLAPMPSMDAGNGVLFDFNHGFRVQMPQGNGVYDLRVYDADTQTLLANLTVPGGGMAVGDRKYFIRYHLEVTDHATGQLIFSHVYNCEGQRVMIVIPDGGLGDNMAWVPYAEEFRKKHHAKVTCVCGEWLIRIIASQYPELEFAPVANIPSSQGFYASYFCAIFPPERKSWRPTDHQNFGMQGSIAKILGVDPVPRKVRFPQYPERPVKEPYVCISVLATNPSKYWNYPDGWNILCRYLKRIGYRVFVIDRDHDLMFDKKVYSVPSEAEDCTGLRPITERMAMLQHADFFVGLPSGLSWLAWNCNTPVVMISGFSMDGSEFPTPYRVFNQNFCHGCWNDSNLFFDAYAPVWCPRHVGTPREIECTRAITPKMVIDAVNRIPTVCTRIRQAVTFAIPVRNPEPAIFGEMLQSVISSAKEYGNAEILIRDDASTEPAAKVLIEDAIRNNPGLISAEYAEKPEGTPAVLRGLLARAAGKYFIPVEQNALLLLPDLQRTIKRLEDHPEVVCSYAKEWFFSGKGPKDIHRGGPFSAFESLYSTTQVQSGTIFRTDILNKCGAWQTRPNLTGSALFNALALYGICEYDPEVRTLTLHQKLTPGKISGEKPGENIKKLIAPYKDTVALLEQGIVPEDKADVPLAALAGGVCFLRRKDKELLAKLLPAVRQRFPQDPGIRMTLLQYLAEQKDMDGFRAEWDAAFRDFQDEELVHYILSPAAEIMLEQGVFSPQQCSFLEMLSERRNRIPGPVIDAWNNVLSAKKECWTTPVKPVRISVIIAVFRGRYIADCVHSIVEAFAPYGQTEILLWNDASPEQGLDLRLKRLQAENPDMIRVFRGNRNLGVALARAEMVRLAKGDYIVSFDHDDIMLPFDVKKAVEFMDANPQYCASYAPKYLFNEKGYMNDIHGSEFSRFQSFFAPKVNINAALLRKTDLIDAGGFLEVNGDKMSGQDDIYLYIRMFQKKDVWFDPEPRTLYRIHNTQITSRGVVWDSWITQQICDQHPELVKRILAGDIPDPCGSDFRIVRGLMGAMIFFHQHEPAITEPIIQAAMKYFPEDPGVADSRLRLFRLENRMDELLEYYPKVLEQFKDTLLPRVNILIHVLSAMQNAKMELPPELVQMYTALSQEYHKLTPIAAATLQRLSKGFF